VAAIDLTTRKTVATIDVGSQAAGLDFWKTEPSKTAQSKSEPTKQ
jgi:hypothetical protein